jgi:hypothetical protein
LSPPRDMAASVRARLLTLARSTGEDDQALLRRYAIERLLHRIGSSEHASRLVVKGATLQALWGGPTYRPTKDLDVLARGNADPDSVVSWLREIATTVVSADGVEFLPASVRAEGIGRGRRYEGVRAHLIAQMGSAVFSVQVDVGFGDAVVPAPIDVTFPVILDGPAPRVRAYARETVVAEKTHAIVSLGTANSRLKDFCDLHLLARRFRFEAGLLREALVATFDRRETPLPQAEPAGLAPDFYSDALRSAAWRGFLARSLIHEVPDDFVVVGAALRRFLLPVVVASDTPVSEWPAGGPWR